MSLDVFVFPVPSPLPLGQLQTPCVYHAKLEETLCPLAQEVGLNDFLWGAQPGDSQATAGLVRHLQHAMEELDGAHQSHVQTLWARYGAECYEPFIQFVQSFLMACETWPHAVVRVYP